MGVSSSVSSASSSAKTFFSCQETRYNLTPSELIEEALLNGEGHLASNGALVCHTGAFTGRAPKDRYIVEDDTTRRTIDWGAINQPLSVAHFDALWQRLSTHLQTQRLYVRDVYVGVDKQTRLSLRVHTTYAWHNLFCHNMFIPVPEAEQNTFSPNFTIYASPDFEAHPDVEGTRQGNFVVINFSKGMIIMGGTAYAGELKKSMFSVMNYLLPEKHQVLPMHCSANVGKAKDTALFFGLSGTGKTTLSADPQRRLIGDDEHGWYADKIANFEGGCYAKVIHLTEAAEPQIWRAIRYGAIVENTPFHKGTRDIDFTSQVRTENTRTSYPIHYIDNALKPSEGPLPKNIFFLTADAFGVLPPIARLSMRQAMYHFVSGYTAKLAGTEAGVDEPQAVFSACFGAPFLPLSPMRYARMLGDKLQAHPEVSVWLINTGWSGGGYGTGERIALKYTRAMITAALAGDLEKAPFEGYGIFDLSIPKQCPHVPDEVLRSDKTWADAQSYEAQAIKLAQNFNRNFAKYAQEADAHEIAKGGPSQV